MAGPLRARVSWCSRCCILALGLDRAPGAVWPDIALAGMLVAGIWMAVSVLRRARGHAIWSLRNRLLVTYLFIAAVPDSAGSHAGRTWEGSALVSQFAVYMVTSQLERRIDTLASFTESVVRTDPASRRI